MQQPFPSANSCVTRHILESRARDSGSKVAVRLPDGSQWTYTQLLSRVRTAANGIRSLDVAEGDHVLVWQPNGPEALISWLAINYMGAICVPLNAALRGKALEHAVDDSGASLLIAHDTLLPHLKLESRPRLSTIVSVGSESDVSTDVQFIPWAYLEDSRFDHSCNEIATQPWDCATIIYTSGTTGPAKGVMCSYAQYFSHLDAWPWLESDDRILISLPLFHVGGTVPAYLAFLVGGSVALQGPFKGDVFMKEVRESGATMTILLGSMAGHLMSLPESDWDRGHALKRIGMVPLVPDLARFTRRFQVNVFTWFGMTEVSVPIVSEFNPENTSACGKLRAGYQAMIVDAYDIPVPEGEIGELLLRSDRPWALNSGYLNQPEATARAWRNGWFHTGDAFRKDAEGNYYFCDRLKDTIRRRGENISSTELESELQDHPEVIEAAVVGVPSPKGEQEILAVVALHPGSSLSPEDLLTFLIPKIAHFMIPRYVRFVDAIPKTETQKVRKTEIRDQGVTADTWDREVVGFHIRRENLN
jgi:crotonobetaine/carnitine-CoA ligase